MNQALSTRAYFQIIQMILSQDLPPGAALQEARLAEILDMSRTPVREAMKRIEAEGLARREGRLLRVRRLDRAEVDEIFSLRLSLEGFAARQAPAIAPEMLARIRARVQTLIAEGPGGSEDERGVDDDFHGMIARAVENRVLARTIAELRLRTCMFDIRQVPDRFLLGCQEHLTILDALEARDGVQAERLMIAHLSHARDAIIRRLSDLEREGDMS
ncbi:MAG: GntR family transcriptional regulator [Paracoccus sp. (in: a-proteobacteria)]|uniref:GntR family transcriptional regulator n=1 Tax=Paracoccus sp. TaxID=267 RepID=UPI0039E4376F